jgi:hypothetical protein
MLKPRDTLSIITLCSATIQNDPLPLLDSKNKRGTLFLLCSTREAGVVRMVLQDALALTSLTLFLAAIAVWAQVLGVI